MYPIPGGLVVNIGKEYLQIFPKFSMGAAMVNQNTFELLMHRNLAQDDNFGLSTGVDDTTYVDYHFEIEIGDLTHKNHMKSYLEAKADVYVLPIVDFRNFVIANEHWSKAEEINENWPLDTLYSLGFNHSEVYLSSAGVKNNEIILRILNLKDAYEGLSINGLEFLEKKFIDGYVKDTTLSNWKQGKEITFDQKSDTGMPKTLPKVDKDTNIGSILLKPYEFATYHVKQVAITIPTGNQEIPIDVEIKQIVSEQEIQPESTVFTIERTEMEISVASNNDIQTLEYAVVFCLSGIVLISIISYFRSRGNRKRID